MSGRLEGQVLSLFFPWGDGGAWERGTDELKGREMKVREYLSRKYGMDKPSTMTKMEAAMFGIPFPLRTGWLIEFGEKVIPQDLIHALGKKLRKREAKQKKRGNKALKHTQSGLSVLGAVADQPYTPRYWPSSKAFYESTEWRKLRYQAIKFHGNKCQCCGATPGYGIVIHVDHIKPR